MARMETDLDMLGIMGRMAPLKLWKYFNFIISKLYSTVWSLNNAPA